MKILPAIFFLSVLGVCILITIYRYMDPLLIISGISWLLGMYSLGPIIKNNDREVCKIKK